MATRFGCCSDWVAAMKTLQPAEAAAACLVLYASPSSPPALGHGQPWQRLLPWHGRRSLRCDGHSVQHLHLDAPARRADLAVKLGAYKRLITTVTARPRRVDVTARVSPRESSECQSAT
jgi:hypothetical protein